MPFQVAPAVQTETANTIDVQSRGTPIPTLGPTEYGSGCAPAAAPAKESPTS